MENVTLKRGIIVDAADGRAYVVWGRTGEVAHLMPLTIKPGSKLVHVVVPSGLDGCVDLYVNTADRRHLNVADLAELGALSEESVAQIVADVSQQRLAAHRAANGFSRSVIAAARAARLRRAAA